MILVLKVLMSLLVMNLQVTSLVDHRVMMSRPVSHPVSRLANPHHQVNLDQGGDQDRARGPLHLKEGKCSLYL